MKDKTLSQKLQEYLSLFEEGKDHPYRKLIGSSSLVGAGAGGAAALAKKGPGILGGAIKGAYVGAVASLLLIGGAGIGQLIKRAKEKGAEQTKQSIRSAISHAQTNDKLTNTQKVAIKNNGQQAIAKIDQVFKNQKKHESLECDSHEKCDKCKKEKEQNESLGLRILEKLDRMIEKSDGPGAGTGALVGAGTGALVGRPIAKKLAVRKAKTAHKDFLKQKRINAKVQGQKSPKGIVAKLKQGANKISQNMKTKVSASTVNAARRAVKHPGGRLAGAAAGAILGGVGMHAYKKAKDNN